MVSEILQELFEIINTLFQNVMFILCGEFIDHLLDGVDLVCGELLMIQDLLIIDSNLALNLLEICDSFGKIFLECVVQTLLFKLSYTRLNSLKLLFCGSLELIRDFCSLVPLVNHSLSDDWSRSSLGWQLDIHWLSTGLAELLNKIIKSGESIIESVFVQLLMNFIKQEVDGLLLLIILQLCGSFKLTETVFKVLVLVIEAIAFIFDAIDVFTEVLKFTLEIISKVVNISIKFVSKLINHIFESI